MLLQCDFTSISNKKSLQPPSLLLYNIQPRTPILNITRVEAGSNTSTATREPWEKTKGEPSAWGIYVQGPGPPAWGSHESETVKCGHESRGTLRMTALARDQKKV
jgi:hypothetical protein